MSKYTRGIIAMHSEKTPPRMMQASKHAFGSVGVHISHPQHIAEAGGFFVVAEKELRIKACAVGFYRNGKAALRVGGVPCITVQGSRPLLVAQGSLPAFLESSSYPLFLGASPTQYRGRGKTPRLVFQIVL